MTAALPVADGVVEAHDEARRAFARPGAWWNGADRLRIVLETRNAPGCRLCADRAEALTPGAVQGEHANGGGLSPIAVEAIHGIRNDSGRLTRRWFDDLIDMGLQREAYVELVSVGAWLPIKREGGANVVRSLGLVPSALKLFFDTFDPSYYMRPDTAFSITPPQVELVASRVSAVNECFY